MMKILTIVGARPQFVKAAALSRVIAKRDGLEEILVHTGQHFDEKMSDIFFDEMQIPVPKYNLEVNSLGHGAMTGRMMEKLENLFQSESPDFVLVYGDTNSTLAGALAAKKIHIPIGHVEAGLRSFNMKMPEEVNRILTDRISDHLFCPTDAAVSNLSKEGYDHFDCEVHKTGDVMQDAALYYASFSSSRSNIVDELGLADFVLVTIHRAENTDDEARLRGIIDALNQIHEETPVVCPLHPRTIKKCAEFGVKPTFEVISPVGYFDMVELLKACSLVMTDSGGLQKEAYFFQNPCITMRDQTEWTELVDHGYNTIVGADPEKIRDSFKSMMNKELDFSVDLYGGGKAAQNIADILGRMA